MSLFLGGALAHLGTVATALALVAVVLGAAVAASGRAWGRLLLVLAAPLTAAGLSYDDWGTSLGAALLLTAGAAYAWLVSLLWPAHAAGATAAGRPPAAGGDGPLRAVARDRCRRRLPAGVEGSASTTRGGRRRPACSSRDRMPGCSGPAPWAASLSVAASAPSRRWRSSQPTCPALVLAALAALALVTAAATRGSRWYVTSAFTTFLVFLMLLRGQEEQAAQQVGERVGETLVGAALAVLFGIVVPALTAGRRRAP